MQEMAMPGSSWSMGSLGSAFAMWAVMMAAVMLPSALPIVRLTEQHVRRAWDLLVEHATALTPRA